VDHHRAVVEVGEDGLLRRAEVVAVGEVGLGVLGQDLGRLVVAETRERRGDRLELTQVALEGGELRLTRLEHVRDDRHEHVLGQLHDVVEVGVGHLGLEHPELGQVPARLRLLGAEGRAEAIHLAQRHRSGLGVELPRLRQEGLGVEVRHLEERRRPLARVGREHRRVDAGELALVEELAQPPDDRVADAQHGPGALAAEPEVPVVEQVVGAVLLGRDRVAVDGLQHLAVRHADLVPTGRALVRLHLADEHQARLLAGVADGLEQLRGHVLLEQHALRHAGTVAQLDEVQLALGGLVVDPAAQLDRLADVLGEVFDSGSHGKVV
jgi:hypothetical protein